MSNWLTDGDEIEFTPDAGWDWQGWDGVVRVSSPRRGMGAGSRAVVLAVDLERLCSELVGRRYTATGFADTPGVVSTATVAVKRPTLATQTRLSGQPIALATTTGTILVAVAPSFKAATPPIPDPVLAKTGTWRVRRSGQAVARSRE